MCAHFGWIWQHAVRGAVAGCALTYTEPCTDSTEAATATLFIESKLLRLLEKFSSSLNASENAVSVFMMAPGAVTALCAYVVCAVGNMLRGRADAPGVCCSCGLNKGSK